MNKKPPPKQGSSGPPQTGKDLKKTFPTSNKEGDKGGSGGPESKQRPQPAKDLPGFAPFAPVIRPGHYDHIEESLIPASADREAIPRHPLEKSSSSFLRGVATPVSTPSEEEAGVMGMNMLCITNKKHYVDPKLGDKRATQHFADVMIIISIIINLPCLILQVLYVLYHEFRFQLLLHYNISAGCFFALLVLNVAIKYFTGLMRTCPYHMIVIIFKSFLWAWIYTLLGCLIEWLYIRHMASMHTNNEYHASLGNRTRKQDEIDEEEYSTYKQFVTKEFTDEHLIPDEDDEIVVKAENVFFLAGIIYAIILMICIRFLSKVAKLNYFGPILPFFTYTLTCILILGGTIYFLINKNRISDDDDKLWLLVQATCAPLIGPIITELFIIYLQAVLRGKLCPLKQEEYLYAAAHL